MKIEIDAGKILLKCLEQDLKDLEESKDDTAITFHYAQSCQVTWIMYECGLLNIDQWQKLNHMIDDIMFHTTKGLDHEYR